MEPCMLAFDLGSSGLKATALSPKGEQLGSATAGYPTHNARGGVSQQQPEDWWRAVCQASAQLFAKAPRLAEAVCAIGTSGHMIGCVPVNAEGEALHPALINSDFRAAAQKEFIEREIGADEMYRMTGNVLDVHSSLCKLLWFKHERPDIYRDTAKFLQSKDFIAARLAGNVDTTDFSDASHGQMIDLAKKDYDNAMLQSLGIARAKLPALRRSHQVLGPLCAAAAKQLGLKQGIPVVAGGGDGSCASAGAGVVSPGAAYCSLGTTAWITFLAAQPVLDAKQRIFNIMTLDGEGYGVFGSMQNACHAFDWACALLGQPDPEAANALAAGVPPGSDGLVFLPYLDGERSPIFDPNARGVYFGLSSLHAAPHLLRATLEGVAYALRSILEVSRTYMPIDEMRIIGGGAASALWRSIISDVCGVALQSVSVNARNATSVGAAMAAGVGAGVYKSYAEAAEIIRVTESQAPRQNPAYEAGYAVYAKLYPAVRELYPKGSC